MSSGRRGVLFDLDGTLTDTTYLHTLCWWQALKSGGRLVPMARIHRAVGMGADQLLDEVLGGSGDLDRDRSKDQDVTAAHDVLFAAQYPRIVALPGARDLLVACRALGLAVVLASSAGEQDLAAELDALGGAGLLDEWTTADDAAQTKPAPDLLQVALKKASLAARDVVYIGDAVWDVQAADHLGIACIGLESGGTSDAELSRAGAAETWTDPLDLLTHLGDSLIAGLASGGTKPKG